MPVVEIAQYFATEEHKVNRRTTTTLLVVLVFGLTACGGRSAAGADSLQDGLADGAIQVDSVQATAEAVLGASDADAIQATAGAALGDADAVRATAEVGLAQLADLQATAEAAGISVESAAATATAVAAMLGEGDGTLYNAEGTPIAENVEGTGPEAARAAIEGYARDVLGISITTTYAGGLSGNVERALDGAGADVSGAVNLAGETFGGLWRGGGASLSMGAGTYTGELDVDINTASLGLYVLLVDTAMPGDEASALNLAKATFPGIADRNYVFIPGETGFTWQAVGQTPGFNPDTMEATTIAEVVALGTVPGNNPGRTIVWVAVGRGDFASQLQLMP